MLLAREALDKLAQVSGIVEGTIISAEEWCERLGRRKSNRPSEQREIQAWQGEQKQLPSAREADTTMAGVDEEAPVRDLEQGDVEMTDQK